MSDRGLTLLRGYATDKVARRHIMARLGCYERVSDWALYDGRMSGSGLTLLGSAPATTSGGRLRL